MAKKSTEETLVDSLIDAAEDGNLQKIRSLVDKGLDVRTCGQGRLGPNAVLRRACSAGQTESVKLLLELGAQADGPCQVGPDGMIRACGRRTNPAIEAAKIILRAYPLPSLKNLRKNPAISLASLKPLIAAEFAWRMNKEVAAIKNSGHELEP